MQIKKAEMEQLPQILPVYEAARQFMAATGNPNQWGKTNPPQEMIRAHIADGTQYIVEHEGQIVGTFAFIPGIDPTYGYIEGQWSSDEAYAAIHSVASNGQVRGVFSQIVFFCEQRSRYLRIDTHRDNKVMQHMVAKHGFSYCGMIYLANGAPRLAYDRMR